MLYFLIKNHSSFHLSIVTAPRETIVRPPARLSVQVGSATQAGIAPRIGVAQLQQSSIFARKGHK